MTAFTAKHPDYDATVAIEIRNGILQFDFLAQGRSQRKKGGVVVGYTKRNPDRRLLFNHIIGWFESRLCMTAPVVGVAHGQGSPFDGETSPIPIVFDLEETSSKFRKGKGFRFRMFVDSNGICGDVSTLTGAWGSWAPNALAELMGLVPSKHKPVTTEWYGLAS